VAGARPGKNAGFSTGNYQKNRAFSRPLPLEGVMQGQIAGPGSGSPHRVLRFRLSAMLKTNSE